MTPVTAVRGLIIWSSGVRLSSGVLNSSSILLKSVVRLVSQCVLVLMDRACAILGCFVAIRMLVDPNLVRYDVGV